MGWRRYCSLPLSNWPVRCSPQVVVMSPAVSMSQKQTCFFSTVVWMSVIEICHAWSASFCPSSSAISDKPRRRSAQSWTFVLTRLPRYRPCFATCRRWSSVGACAVALPLSTLFGLLCPVPFPASTSQCSSESWRC